MSIITLAGDATCDGCDACDRAVTVTKANEASKFRQVHLLLYSIVVEL